MRQQKKQKSVLRLLLDVLFMRKPKSNVTPAEINLLSNLRESPDVNDRNAWGSYWKTHNQPWRIEPEIENKRQEELKQHLAVVPNIEKGIYPFKGIKLSRADVEWLLAAHDNGRGPIIWNNETQDQRVGIDLRGADLRQVDLSGLPLTRFRGGLILSERINATVEQCEMATVHLEGCSLSTAHLEQAGLYIAHLEGANLFRTHLERAFLRGSHLEGADLSGSHMQRAYLRGADLRKTDLKRADLEKTELANVIIGDDNHVGPQIADSHWREVNLAVIEWSSVEMLGDELVARQKRRSNKEKERTTRLNEHERAVRANRQLAVALQSQGLNEDAARFAYRAQVLQRKVFRIKMLQRKIRIKRRGQILGALLFSWLLYLLAGYGYKPGRSFLAYLLVISIFMIAYHFISPHLGWDEAFVLSMTAFHGRGFSPSTFTPGSPLSFVSAVEALVGLIIEVTFIATLTQRFFGR